MKFYFDGELIRTSKAHRYTHAVVLPTKPGGHKQVGRGRLPRLTEKRTGAAGTGTPPHC